MNTHSTRQIQHIPSNLAQSYTYIYIYPTTQVSRTDYFPAEVYMHRESHRAKQTSERFALP